MLCDRFVLLSQIGAGAMGDVYRARDRMRGQDIALKLLPDLDATALLRFKNEFRAVHDIEHPNLVRLHELHEDRGAWFFTMQLVDGVDVLRWIDGDIARLRAVLPQIAHAIHRLHDAGLVHRDVKPSNVLVTLDGTAMLLDFGLVTPQWSPGEGAGTPAFMAPEQIAGDITIAADWYSFGVVLFQALTGRLPFEGTAEEIMRAKLERPAPRVRTIASDTPPDLAALADALLERRPHARPSGAAVLAALGTRADRTHVSRELLIGRERELAELRRAVADRMAGESIAVAIIGESGIGKTSLLRELAQELALGGSPWVLGGRCWERESVPYKGFDGVVEELAARLEADDVELRDAGWNTILAQAFPSLRRVRGFSERALGEIRGHETAARVSTALRWLFSEVAARQPLVVLLDDLQWADRDTLVLLRALFAPPIPNVLVAFAARAPIAFDEQTNIRTISLAPLSEAETTALVDLVVRDLGGAFDAGAIAREVAGHPLFAWELARHVVETGEVQRISFEDVVRRQVARFGEQALHIATIVGLAYVPLSIDAASHAAGASEPTFFDSLAALRGAQIVATSGVGAGTRLEPYHDRIRRTLTERLSPADRGILHERIARALEATGSHDHAALAQHWQHAGNVELAAMHTLRAAEQAETALAFHRAADLYAYALSLAPSPQIRVRHAECLAQAGLGVAAADAFLACSRDASGAEALDLRRRAMQQLLLMGHNDRALALLDELMRWLDLPNPTKPAELIWQLVQCRAWIRLRRPVLPPVEQDPSEGMERVRLDVLWDAAAGLAFVDPLRSFFLHSLDLKLCFRSNDASRLARALLGEAPYLAASGNETKRLTTCLVLADQAAARNSFHALTPLARGTVAFLFGRWRECRERLAECQRLLQQDRPRLVKEGFGPAQLQDVVRRLELAAMFYLGDLQTLHRRVTELLQDALERNDVTSATHLRSGIMASLFLARGERDAAVRHASEGFRPWQRSRVGVPHFMDLQARSLIAIFDGRGADAHAEILAMWPRLERARLARARFIEISLYDVRGRAAIAAGALDDAALCARRLAAIRAPWATPLGETLEAGLALARGDDDRSRGLLEHAAKHFASVDMHVHSANARMVSATLAGDAATAVRQRQELASAGVVDIDKYSRLLVPRQLQKMSALSTFGQ